jgi:hypothetical protein
MQHQISCPKCHSKNNSIQTSYITKNNGSRKLLKCNDCEQCYSETCNTFMFNIKASISKIAIVINARTEGMSFNATCRVHEISSHTLQSWETKFSQLKDTLMAYTLLHAFISLTIEGDELYTKVGKNVPQHESKGWTIMLMDRASRFVFDLTCGEKNEALFINAMQRLSEIIEVTGDLSLVTDGESRYSKYLFEICHDLVNNGKPGRPKKVLAENIRIKMKNKGSQAHKLGPKKKKYVSPKAEHPNTAQTLNNSDIHANHVESQNATVRRKNAAYRRKTNTYAKTKVALQRTLDLYWVVHNFVREHFTTKEVPAVSIGVINKPMSLHQIMMNVSMVF